VLGRGFSALPARVFKSLGENNPIYKLLFIAYKRLGLKRQHSFRQGLVGRFSLFSPNARFYLIRAAAFTRQLNSMRQIRKVRLHTKKLERVAQRLPYSCYFSKFRKRLLRHIRTLPNYLTARGARKIAAVSL
jgi:hypothetical protein